VNGGCRKFLGQYESRVTKSLRGIFSLQQTQLRGLNAQKFAVEHKLVDTLTTRLEVSAVRYYRI
jgi:hypothetical protein